MKKATKAVLITSGSLLLCGIIICTAALISVGFNVREFSTADEPHEGYEAFTVNGNESLIITQPHDDLKIVKSSDDKLHVRYCELGTDCVITQDERAITVEEFLDTSPWYENISFFDFDSELSYDLVVELPEQFTGSVSIEAMSEVTISDFDFGDSLTINANNCNVTLDSVTAKRLEIADASGISCTDCSVEGNAIMKADCNISLDSVSCGNLLDCSSGCGDIIATASLRANDITMQTTVGSISFENADAQKLTAASQNCGNITGSVVGKPSDYTVFSSADNGENNLSNITSTGARILNVRTYCATIDVDFTGE